jgi:hypothetical protein
VVLLLALQMFIPFTVFGALAVTSGMAILTMMPETLGAAMPENITVSASPKLVLAMHVGVLHARHQRRLLEPEVVPTYQAVQLHQPQTAAA